jgi:hypothetical protein
MAEPVEKRTWSQARRFEFLEWKMFWEDRVIRSDLESTFSISTPQASVDLRHYRERAPGNMEQTARGYRPSEGFRPQFYVPSADRLLLQLRALLSKVIRREDVWFRDLPPVDIVPDIARDVPADCLRPILVAIRERHAIEVRYQSLTSSRRRAIAPHALAYDGHRWHARAWCCEREEFRDFLLSRMDEFGATKPADYDPEDDVEWETKLTLRLRPRRELDIAQQSAIAKDYGMKDGHKDVEIRASLAFYFIRRMNLDLKSSDDTKLKAERLQIELENLAEIESAVTEARREAMARVAARRQGDTG